MKIPFNIKKAEASEVVDRISSLRAELHTLTDRLAADIAMEEAQQVTQQMQSKTIEMNTLKQLLGQQVAQEMMAQEELDMMNNNLQNTGIIGQSAMIKNKNEKKAFNLKKAQFENPAGSAVSIPGMGDTLADPELMEDGIEEMGMFSNLKDGADLKDRLDNLDYITAREELINLVEETDQQLIEDALSSFYQEGIDSNGRVEIAAKIFDLLPDSNKIIDLQDEGTVIAPFSKAEVDEEIRKLAKRYSKKKGFSFNLTKTAQHKTLENAIVWNTNAPRLDPFLRQPVSDWHIMERNKGFGLTVGPIWNIDWETIWRENIMDKYSRPYKDKDGNWVGGYVEKRFEVDKNIPEINNMQLKPGQKRRPILPEYGNTESRLEAARAAGEIDGAPVVEGKPFNWKEAKKKVSSTSSS